MDPFLKFLLICVACLIVLMIILGFLYSDIHKKRTEIKKTIESDLTKNNFSKSGSIDYQDIYAIQIDTINKKIACCMYIENKYKIFTFSEIINCKVYEDNSVVTSGGLGGAIIGGVLGGTTGAIIGSNAAKAKSVVNNMRLEIITNNIIDPLYVFRFVFKTPEERNSIAYQNVAEFIQKASATLESIISQNPK
jgi:hypothetical protein